MSQRNQPVCFNMADAYEKELFDFAIKQQRFFSRYVKRLIERDRDGRHASTNEVDTTLAINESNENKEDDADVIAGFF